MTQSKHAPESCDLSMLSGNVSAEAADQTRRKTTVHKSTQWEVLTMLLLVRTHRPRDEAWWFIEKVHVGPALDKIITRMLAEVEA